MKHKVKKPFIDRDSGERMAVGDVIEVTDERAAELQDAGVLNAKEEEGGEPRQSASRKRPDAGSTGSG
jgi:hypothetical protein